MGLFDKFKGKKEPLNELPTEKNTVYAPVAGALIALADFPDEAFSDGALGQGCGIHPTEEIIKAPFHGKVVSLHASKHALGLVSQDGVELLIHIGVDTVTMDGNGFEAFVKAGDEVGMGQKLVKFSIAQIEAAGFSSAIGITVLNSANYKEIKIAQPGDISAGAPIFTLVS